MAKEHAIGEYNITCGGVIAQFVGTRIGNRCSSIKFVHPAVYGNLSTKAEQQLQDQRFNISVLSMKSATCFIDSDDQHSDFILFIAKQSSCTVYIG